MKTTRAQTRLTNHIGTSLGQALRGLTGAEFDITPREKMLDSSEEEEPFLWQQSFASVDGPAFWIAAGKHAWDSLGRATLEAAGVESPSPEDCRSTWQETVSQTMAALAAAIAGDMEREITATQGEELKAEPPGIVWTAFSVTAPDNKTFALKAAWSPALAALYEVKSGDPRNVISREAAVSRTFDLLLDVALPVSVSFGRTSLQIREVLKLNTGSIVELDRFVSDPVEVIVNDCVIGRGEVVVVDGNYGVRINQLASREDRLRTGMAEQARLGGRP